MKYLKVTEIDLTSMSVYNRQSYGQNGIYLVTVDGYKKTKHKELVYVDSSACTYLVGNNDYKDILINVTSDMFPEKDEGSSSGVMDKEFVLDVLSIALHNNKAKEL